MRRELRPLYGSYWRRQRKRALDWRGHKRCELCDLSHPMINWAHLRGHPTLHGAMMWLCPTCHGRLDSPVRVMVTRRTKAVRSGQLWLCAEMEYAHLPMQLWPAEIVRAVEDAAQLRLFSDPQQTI